jgi:hypothetical protein
LREVFANLADEVRRRIISHESCRAAVLR